MFDKSWDGYMKTAQFTLDKVTYNMILDKEGTTFVPPVLTKGRWSVSVFGIMKDNNNDKRWTTIESYIDVVKSGYRTDGTVPVEPPQDYYQLLIEEIRKSKIAAENAADRARVSELNCEAILKQFNYDLSLVDDKVKAEVDRYIRENVYTKDEVYNKVEIDTNIQQMSPAEVDNIIGGI